MNYTLGLKVPGNKLIQLILYFDLHFIELCNKEFLFCKIFNFYLLIDLKIKEISI